MTGFEEVFLRYVLVEDSEKLSPSQLAGRRGITMAIDVNNIDSLIVFGKGGLNPSIHFCSRVRVAFFPESPAQTVSRKAEVVPTVFGPLMSQTATATRFPKINRKSKLGKPPLTDWAIQIRSS